MRRGQRANCFYLNENKEEEKSKKGLISYVHRLSKSPIRCVSLVQVVPLSNAPTMTPVSIALTFAKPFQESVLVTAGQIALSFASHLCLGVWSQAMGGKQPEHWREQFYLESAFPSCNASLKSFPHGVNTVSTKGPRVSLSPSCGVLLSEINRLEKLNSCPQGSCWFSQGMQRKVWNKGASVAGGSWFLFMGIWWEGILGLPAWAGLQVAETQNVGACKQAWSLENSSVHFALVCRGSSSCPLTGIFCPLS